MNTKQWICLVLSSFACIYASAEGSKHHYFGIFQGYTHIKDETEFTYGLEYEYKFNSQWGAGLVYEKSDKLHHGDGVDVSLGSVYYHPESWRFGLGFGREKIGGDHPHSENLTRVSAGYDFHVGDFEIAPAVAVDFVNGDEATVFGLAILKSF